MVNNMTYTANSDRNVKVLSSTVFLESVDIKPNLNIEAHKHLLRQRFIKTEDN